MASSHLFFGLPTLLLAFAPMLSPGFQFAAFFVHLDSGSDAILIANLHFIFSLSFNPTRNVCSTHPFFFVFCASFYVFDPFFFFNFCCIDIFVCLVQERYIHRCLDRIPYLCCFLHPFRLRYPVGPSVVFLDFNTR